MTRVAAPLRAPNVRAREKVLGPLVRRVRSACDLCCGTGTTALALARLLARPAYPEFGGETPPLQPGDEIGGPRPREINSDRPLQPRVYAVDRSREMLRVARAKFRSARAPVKTIHADMRTFRLPEPVDLVTCEFDAINHLNRKQGLKAVASAVARALSPGGWFLFDANTTKAFKELWIMNWIQEGRGFFLGAHSGYDPKRDKGWTKFDWFVAEQAERSAGLYARHAALPTRSGRVPGGATGALHGWRRYTERYEEVAWSEDEIRQALAAAGLRVTGAWDLVRFARGAPWAKPGCRIFWLAQKCA